MIDISQLRGIQITVQQFRGFLRIITILHSFIKLHSITKCIPVWYDIHGSEQKTMVTQVHKNIYRIRLTLPQNPLKNLNSYFLRGDESDLLIDTGFRRPECRKDLLDGLAMLGSFRDRRRVYVTHMHGDHIGQADLVCGDDRPIYLSATDLGYYKRFLSGEMDGERLPLYVRQGYPEEILKKTYSTNQAITMTMDHADERLCAVEEGTLLRVGTYELRVISVPGHTPGNTMLWMEKEGIMFTGDHVLFDITPNITSWPWMDDALGAYIESLKKVKDYPVRLALPGHRESGEYKSRIEEILAHHERRLADTLRIIRETPYLSAYEIASRMKWKIRASSWEEFPLQQRWFATGECLSHLDYLKKRGSIRSVEENGVVRYCV